MYEQFILEKKFLIHSAPQQVSKDALIQPGKQFVRNVILPYLCHNKTNHGNVSSNLFDL